MKLAHRSVEQLVGEQVNLWSRRAQAPSQARARPAPVVTISRETGSGGDEIGRSLAVELGYDYFDREIIREIAQSAKMSTAVVATLDERKHRLVEDWIAAFFSGEHLWADEFLRHLMKVVCTIGKHGGAVILGRGANFALPRDEALRVRIVADLPARVAKVAADMGILRERAMEHIQKAEADRVAFVRQYFNAQLYDPQHYDLVLRSDILGYEGAVATIKAAVGAFTAAGRQSAS